MKILLINPPIHLPFNLNIGILNIASLLKYYEFDCEQLDLNIKIYKIFKKEEFLQNFFNTGKDILKLVEAKFLEDKSKLILYKYLMLNFATNYQIFSERI